MMKSLFGSLPDGREIYEFTLKSAGLTAKVLNWGAVIRDLRLEGHAPALVLGLNSLDDYVAGSAHMGAIAGRCANRIAGGRFSIDGTDYQVDCNVNGNTHLHGGELGFGIRPWDIEDFGTDYVTFSLHSKAGESGYPGAVDVKATYRVFQTTLSLEISAETTAPTLVNLAHHSYFRLDNNVDCTDTLIEIDADAYTPLTASLVPSGEVKPVAGTVYDLRQERAIGSTGTDYDVNFCLAAMPRRIPAYAATARSLASGISMEVWTTEPGIQFYDAAKMHMAVPGLDGLRYGPKSGFCLEPQRWPDAPNHRYFPSATLRPGETYHQHSEFRFSK